MTRYAPNWLQAPTYSASLDRQILGAIWPQAATYGLQVSATGGTMTLDIQPGQCAVPTANNTGSVVCVSDAVEHINLGGSPATGLNRIELIIVRPRGTDLDGGANNDWIIDHVPSADLATPTVPATPAGCCPLAQVYVGGGVAAITNANISDLRPSGLALSRDRGVIAPGTDFNTIINPGVYYGTQNNAAPYPNGVNLLPNGDFALTVDVAGAGLYVVQRAVNIARATFTQSRTYSRASNSWSAWHSPPAGVILGRTAGPAAQQDCTTTFRNIFGPTIAVIPGRSYLVVISYFAQQLTTAAAANTQVVDGQSGVANRTQWTQLPVGQYLIGTGDMIWTATALANSIVQIQGQTAAGTLRFPANASSMAISDLGNA